MALHDREGGGTAAPNGQLVEEVPLVHKVLVPPPGGIFKEVGQGIWETFFYDAPVDRFRGQSKRIKSWLGLKFLFPMLEWITSYKSRMFVGDLIAGITIASLAIPQAPLFPNQFP